MEGLLGVRSPLDPISKKTDAVRERDESTSRALHSSTDVERIEEDRWQAGIGKGGAFGNRTSQVEREGLERTTWEFRDEETEVRERKVAAKTAGSGPAVKQATDEVAAAMAGSDTPEAQRVQEALAHPPRPATSRQPREPSVQAGKYTFVDVSGGARWKLDKKDKRTKA